jgi:hypothetical protein
MVVIPPPGTCATQGEPPPEHHEHDGDEVMMAETLITSDICIEIMKPPGRLSARRPEFAMTVYLGVLNRLFAAENGKIVVIPVDGSKKITSLANSLTTMDEFQSRLQFYDRKSKWCIYHKIGTSRAIEDIKFDENTNTDLMSYMKTNRVQLRTTHFGQDKDTIIGYLTGIHPKITRRDRVREKLSDALELMLEAMPDNTSDESNSINTPKEVPEFELVKWNITIPNTKKSPFAMAI